MEHLERAWHEKGGLAACRRSDNQHDCQHGQGLSLIHIFLEKREYLGHTINFKTRKHFKDKKSHYVPEDEWTIFENTHCLLYTSNEQFTGKYCEKEYVKRLRKSYDKRMNELNEVLKTVITSLSITARCV